MSSKYREMTVDAVRAEFLPAGRRTGSADISARGLLYMGKPVSRVAVERGDMVRLYSGDECISACYDSIGFDAPPPPAPRAWSRGFSLSLRRMFQTGQTSCAELAESLADIRRTRCHHKGMWRADMAVMAGIIRAEIRRRAEMLPPAPPAAPEPVAETREARELRRVRSAALTGIAFYASRNVRHLAQATWRFSVESLLETFRADMARHEAAGNALEHARAASAAGIMRAELAKRDRAERAAAEREAEAATGPASVAEVSAWAACTDYLEFACCDVVAELERLCAEYAAETAAEFTASTGRPVASVAELAAAMVAHCMEYAREPGRFAGWTPAWLTAELAASGPMCEPVAAFYYPGRDVDSGYSVTIRPHGRRFALVRHSIDGTEHMGSLPTLERATAAAEHETTGRMRRERAELETDSNPFRRTDTGRANALPAPAPDAFGLRVAAERGAEAGRMAREIGIEHCGAAAAAEANAVADSLPHYLAFVRSYLESASVGGER